MSDTPMTLSSIDIANIDGNLHVVEPGTFEIAEDDWNAVRDQAARVLGLEAELAAAKATIKRVDDEWLPAHDEICRRAETASDRVSELEGAITEALDLVEPEEDIRDGADGHPQPNLAMRVAQILRAELKHRAEKAESASTAEREKVAELERERDFYRQQWAYADDAYEAAEARAARLEKALRELVRLKGLHDEIERLEQNPSYPSWQVNRVYFMKATYAAEKPLAWAAARAELQEGPKEGTL